MSYMTSLIAFDCGFNEKRRRPLTRYDIIRTANKKEGSANNDRILIAHVITNYQSNVCRVCYTYSLLMKQPIRSSGLQCDDMIY